MKVLLVIYDNNAYIHWLPQGLAYIAAILKNDGHEVEVYTQDKDHYSEDHLTAYLDSQQYDMVGLSITGGYYQYRKLLKLSEAINQSKRRPFFVIGGHGPAPEPEYFLKKTLADVVVIGEGENTILELVDVIDDIKPLSKVKGIAYRNGDKVIINERRPLIEDIDTIPWPAYELFPMEYYRLLRMPHTEPTDFVMPLLSGRGCTFNCNFCYRMDKGFRPRSNEGIIEEIQYLKKEYGITYIAFSDELLMSSVERTASLCEAFIKANLNIKWDCNGRLNYAKPEVLKLMKKAGCVFINYGIEAMDNATLKKMGKALTTDIISRGVEATLTEGISPGLNIIFGNIDEDRETLKKGVDFLINYDDGAQMRTIRPVTPYPGCPLFDYAIEHGLLRDVEDFYENKHLNSDLLSVNFTKLSDDEFHEALLEANTRLIKNYYHKHMEIVLNEAENLYLNKNSSFRGFRQS